MGRGSVFMFSVAQLYRFWKGQEGTRPNGGNGSDARMFVVHTFID